MVTRLKARLRFGVAACLSAAIFAASPVLTAPSYAQLKGPESVADLAAPLLDAVVNIATRQSSKEKGRGPVAPKADDDAPFKELFEDFFDEGNKNQGGRVSSQGSGFVIDPKGYIVTNSHVITNADEIEVIFPDGKKLPAKLIGSDTKTDLSVLKVEPRAPLKAVKFGDSKQLRIGDWVMAIGNPFGLGGSLSVGIVSARGRNINSGPYDNFIQTDAAINKGNSGGPLFNLAGDVIGINTAIISPTGGSIGIGFAVPTELAENIVNQLIEFGKVRRGWLGVRLQPVDENVVATFELKEERGALVSSIIDSGPAASGDIKTGDIVLALDGKQVKEMRDLPRIVAESPVETPLDMEVIRDGKVMTLKVTLAALPEEVADAQQEAAKSNLPKDGTIEPPEGEGEITPNGEELFEPEEGEGEAEGQLEEGEDAIREAPKTVLSMGLVVLSNELRAKHNIVETVEGVLVDSVDPSSQAARKGIKAGDVIVEVGQDFMEVPGDVLVRINGLKSDGRRNAYMMIANNMGDLRVVALPLE